MIKKLQSKDLKGISGSIIVEPDDLGFTIDFEDEDYKIIEDFYNNKQGSFRRRKILYDLLGRLYRIGYGRDWDLKIIGEKHWAAKNMECETKDALYSALGGAFYSNEKHRTKY